MPVRMIKKRTPARETAAREALDPSKARKMVVAAEKRGGMERKTNPPAPPPPTRPLPRPAWPTRSRAAAVRSVTRDEIERFWRRKRMEEEDHLLAALKAAARIRARTLKEEEYKQFEASLEGVLNSCYVDGVVRKNAGSGEETREDGPTTPTANNELRMIIRDWWTKSTYAYLNQPAVRSMEPEAAPGRVSTFTPNSCYFPAVSPGPPFSALGVV